MDLLTLSQGRGGFDTPSRLLLFGAKLGYSNLGVIADPGTYPKGVIPGTRVVRVGRHGSRAARRSEITVAWGRGARAAAFRGDVGFIIPDPRDRVTLRIAAENNVPVAHAYARVLAGDTARRAQTLREWNQVHECCRKYGCREFLVSGARSSYLMRDPRDAAAMAGSWLGLGNEEALDWMTSTPESVLKEALEGGWP